MGAAPWLAVSFSGGGGGFGVDDDEIRSWVSSEGFALPWLSSVTMAWQGWGPGELLSRATAWCPSESQHASLPWSRQVNVCWDRNRRRNVERWPFKGGEYIAHLVHMASWWESPPPGLVYMSGLRHLGRVSFFSPFPMWASLSSLICRSRWTWTRE